MTINESVVHAKHTWAMMGGALLAVIITVLGHGIVNAATFTVTNTNDSGAGSLRQAISDANGNGNPGTQDLIEFNVPVVGDITIQPQTQLEITENVLIDGYTQSDATPNSLQGFGPMDGLLRVEIDNSVAGSILVTGDNVTLQGLVINRSFEENIEVVDADNFALYGTYIDVGHNGLLVKRDMSSSSPSISIVNSADVQIGGDQAIERNVIAFCISSCVYAEGEADNQSSGLRIQGSHFNVGSDGISNLANSDSDRGAIAIDLRSGTDDALIGGTLVGEGNLIERSIFGALSAQNVSGLEVYGNIIQMTASSNLDGGSVFLGGVVDAIVGQNSQYGRNIISGNFNGLGINVANSSITNDPSIGVVIEGNYMGVTHDAETAFGNHGVNIEIHDDSEYVLIQHNILANTKSLDSVVIDDQANDVTVMQNSIYDNFALGINITKHTGVTGNDSGDVDTGPNDVLNFPQDVTYEEDDSSTTMRYDLDVPAGDYRVEFYGNDQPDSSGNGEGKTYLGYGNISHTGSGIEEFVASVGGVGHENITLTLTEIDASSPYGFGATSEFSATATEYTPPPPPPPVTDLSTSLTLSNPEDVAVGATLEYIATVHNRGPDSIDIGPYDNSNFGVNAMMQLVAPTDLNLISTSAGLNCTALGHGAAGFVPGGLFQNHADHDPILCGYSGGSTILDVGESISFTVFFEVDGSSDLDFALWSQVASPITDPEQGLISFMYGQGTDILDQLVGEFNYPPNNFAVAVYPQADLGISKTLTSEGELNPGDTVTYDITVSNEGTNDIDLSAFDGSGMNPLVTSVFIDLLPPELTYVSATANGIACQYAGDGSASFANPLFANHEDHGLIICFDTAGSVLAPGESITVNLETILEEDSGLDFTNYAYTTSIFGDPDYMELQRAYIVGASAFAGLDILDYMELNDTYLGNSYDTANYTFTEPNEPGNGEENSGTQGGANGSNSGQSNGESNLDGSELANTGDRLMLLRLVASVLMGSMTLLIALYFTKKTENQSLRQ